MGGVGKKRVTCLMQKILVTGNEGYIGSVLVERLLQKGYHVIGFDLGIFKDVAFGKERTAPRQQIYKDVRDMTIDDLRGIDAVIHLAALSNDPLGYLDPELTFAINHVASVRLASIAKEAGVKRFLFSSSCSIYGVAGDALAEEEAPLNPQTPYAESKVRAERDIAMLADETFSPVFLRNATVFGISPRMRLDLVAQDLAASGYVLGSIKVISDGTPWRPLIHIQDVADAFCLILELPVDKIHNRAFNIGHRDNNLQVAEIARAVARHIPGSRVDIRNEIVDDKRSYRVDFSQGYALGFRPRWTIDPGIKEIIDAFKRYSLNREDLASDSYITLKRYQTLMGEGKMDRALRLV